MKRFLSTALITALCSTLLASASAFAAGAAPTAPATQATSTPTMLAAEARVTCGKLVDLDPNSALIKRANGTVVKVKLTDNTDYRPNNQAAAIAGLKQGDFVSARVSDGGEGFTQVLRYGLHDFCLRPNEIIVEGKITDHSARTLTIAAKNGDPYIFELTNQTHYFVNGHPVANRPDLDNGEAVRVKALREADGSYSALIVWLTK